MRPRDRKRGFLIGAHVILGLVIEVLVGVSSAVISQEWTRHHLPLVLAVTGVLVAAWVIPSIRSAEVPAPPLPPTGAPALEEALLARHGQVVVGDIPGRPPVFIARPEVEQLADAFAVGDRVASVSALSGGRGSGKTQIAAEYARQAIADDDVDLVAWVNAESESTLLHGMVTIADRLGVADPSGDSARSARRLREALSTRRAPAVLVFDNATDPDLVRSHLPTSGSVRCIITTTHRAFRSVGTEVVVLPFARSQSIDFLRQRTGLNDPAGANAVAKALGDLPLALAQAATVMVLQGHRYQRYLKLLDALPLRRILPKDRGDSYPRAVAAAIHLSVDAVERADPSGTTTRVLRTISVLSEEGARRETLSRVADAGGARFDEALGRLAEASLVVWTTDREAVIMHRLVSRSIRDRLEHAGRLDQAIADATTRLPAPATDDVRTWEQRHRTMEIVRHALTLWRETCRGVARGYVPEAAVEARWPLFQRAQSVLLAQYGGSEALPPAIETSSTLARLLGPTHHLTLDARNYQAWAHMTIGDLNTAVPMFEENVAAARQALGPQEPDALIATHGLATAYVRARRASDAVPLLEQTVADWQSLKGPQHPRTLEALGLLADAEGAAGNLTRAAALAQETLVGREAVLGPDHRNTLIARTEVARSALDRGQPDEAASVLLKTLPATERIIGTGHPDAVTARVVFAQARLGQGAFNEAIPLLENCVRANAENLGSDHPNTLQVRRILATAFFDAGQFDRGLPLIEAVVADGRRVLGDEHPETLTASLDLAAGLREAGRAAQATPLLRTTLDRCSRALGSLHRLTVSGRIQLAACYASIGQPRRAVTTLTALVAEHDRAGEPAHPTSVNARLNLGVLHLALGEASMAVPTLTRALEDAERVAGTHSRLAADCRHHLREAKAARRKGKRKR